MPASFRSRSWQIGFNVFWLTTIASLQSQLGCSALTSPVQPQQQRRPHHGDAIELHRSVASLGLVAVTLLGLPAQAPASQALQVDVDFPAILQIAKDNQEVVKKLALQTASAVKVTGKPDNLVQFLRDAGAGDVVLEVNGLPLDVSLLSEKGVVDVGVWTDKADLSFTVSSQYLPKLPLLLKRFPAVTDVDSAKEREATFEEALAPAVPFADQTWFDILDKGWTNQQVLGYGSLGLGAAYATTYAYYLKGIQEEEAEAEKKRQAAAEKRKSAAKSQPKSETSSAPKQVKDRKQKELDVESSTAKNGDLIPLAASANAVEPSSSNVLAVPIKSRSDPPDDQPKKKRKWYKLGFR